jgi:hypothetical protein
MPAPRFTRLKASSGDGGGPVNGYDILSRIRAIARLRFTLLTCGHDVCHHSQAMEAKSASSELKIETLFEEMEHVN